MQIRDVLRRRRTLSMGAVFGVMTVVGPRGAGQVEVATFRQDETYSDGRHPDAVSFSTPEADAQRRDFTVNGLFFDPVAAEVIDFVDGRADLERRLIRAIGEPRHRFAEDKLRMLRAVRFTAVYDFVLDEATREAICEMAAQVTVVSAERIAAELTLMLASPRRSQAMELLAEVGLLAIILPEVATTGDCWLWTLAVLRALERPSVALGLAALLHRYVGAGGAEQIARRLKLSNQDTKRASWLVERQSALVGAVELPWSRWQRLLVAEGARELIDLHAAIAQIPQELGPDELRASAVDLAECRRRFALPSGELDPTPLLTGDDLIRHGVPRGRIYQKLLDAARDAQLDGLIHSREEALTLVDRLLP